MQCLAKPCFDALETDGDYTSGHPTLLCVAGQIHKCKYNVFTVRSARALLTGSITGHQVAESVSIILKDGKQRGELLFDVAYFPVLKPQVNESGVEELPESSTFRFI